MDGTKRSNIKIGSNVSIVLKEDQRSGKLTDGVVQDILTNSAVHPHGIKVRLESGEVGRVKAINDWLNKEYIFKGNRELKIISFYVIILLIFTKINWI